MFMPLRSARFGRSLLTAGGVLCAAVLFATPIYAAPILPTVVVDCQQADSKTTITGPGGTSSGNSSSSSGNSSSTSSSSTSGNSTSGSHHMHGGGGPPATKDTSHQDYTLTVTNTGPIPAPGLQVKYDIFIKTFSFNPDGNDTVTLDDQASTESMDLDALSNKSFDVQFTLMSQTMAASSGGQGGQPGRGSKVVKLGSQSGSHQSLLGIHVAVMFNGTEIAFYQSAPDLADQVKAIKNNPNASGSGDSSGAAGGGP
jgi:hypothetical protein